MPVLKDLEIGVMFWAKPDAAATIGEYKDLGARCGQVGIAGDYALEGAGAKWKAAIQLEAFPIVTAFCAYNGESYADAPTVEATVGFIPPATREERIARTLNVSDFAAEAGIPSIACHAGFVPEDTSNANYIAVRDAVRKICDHAKRNGQTFALETGQEPADNLLKFLDDCARPNLGINFDPANMILYGTGDPIQALEILAPRVISVHCKDGEWPPKGVAGALGNEKPLGEGAVGMPQFIAKLKQLGYKGALNIERELEDPRQRIADIRKGVELLQRLTA